jgi:uncharacterized membrane protein
MSALTLHLSLSLAVVARPWGKDKIALQSAMLGMLAVTVEAASCTPALVASRLVLMESHASPSNLFLGNYNAK